MHENGRRDNGSEDEETVKVEYFIHERAVQYRILDFFFQNQKTSFRWNVLRLVLKLASCALYVLRAVHDDDNTLIGCEGCQQHGSNTTKWCCPYKNATGLEKYYSLLWVHCPFWVWSMQTAIAVISLIDSILYLYLSKESFFKVCGIPTIVDIVTALPLVISVFWKDIRNFYTFTFLHCWVAKHVLSTVLNDFHRIKVHESSALSQKLFLVVASLLCLIFTSMCGIQHLERVYERWTMFDSLWFITVTLSTVGYGDIVPKDPWARAYVIVMIVLALMMIPREIEQLAYLLALRQKGGEVYTPLLASDRHVVICSTHLNTNTVMDFLNEFYADPKLKDMQVVMLTPSDADAKLRQLLQVPMWAKRVTYLKGSALNDRDLVRAKVIDAAGCFILADRSSLDAELADHETILRTWAVQDFAPATPLFVQILKPENKFHVSFAEHVVCEGEVKHALLASNCICPGISTFITLLLHTLHEEKGSSSEKWQEFYGKCAGNEIYDIQLGSSKIFRKFAYKSFTYTAYHTFKTYGITLIGVQQSEENSPILLNPGPTYKMGYHDTCFYIAVTREEDTLLVEKPVESSKQSMRSDSRNSFNSMIEQIDEANMYEQDLSLYNLSADKPTAFKGSGVTPTPAERTIKLPIGDSSHCETDLDFDSESSIDSQSIDLAMVTDALPSYVTGIPPVSPYVGCAPLKCHLLKEAIPVCCMEIGSNRLGCEHKTRHTRIQSTQKIAGGVIIASPQAEAGLYNFILPLRAYYRPRCTLKPILLLVSQSPSFNFLEAVSCFPLVYFMVGSFQSLDDLLQAGILEADRVVITNQRHSLGLRCSDEQFMDDAYTIIGVQTIYRLFPSTSLIIELTHPSNMKFMKFDVDSTRINIHGETSKEVIRSTIKRRYHLHKSRKDHLNYLFREPFAAGNVFSASMIDTLLYQTFLKSYMIRLICQLLGCLQTPGSGYLTSMEITEKNIYIGNYGCLFKKLSSTTYDIPIGLYRTYQTPKETRETSTGPSLMTPGLLTPMYIPSPTRLLPETHDLYGIVSNRLKNLGLDGKPDTTERKMLAYSAVNPPPNFKLKLGDIIYLIRTTVRDSNLKPTLQFT